MYITDEDKVIRYLEHTNPPRRQETLQELADTCYRCARMRRISKMGQVKLSILYPTLIAGLENENEKVRRFAIEALGYFKVDQAVPNLILSSSDSIPFVRKTAILALGEIGDSKSSGVILRALQDEVPWVRKAAVVAVRKVKIQNAVPVLIELIGKKSPRYLRKQTAIALGELGDAKVVPFLLKALEDDSIIVRFGAIEGLGKLADEGTIEYIIKCLDDDDPRIRKRAVRALVNFNSELAILGAQFGLKDEIWNIQKTARWVLSQLEGRNISSH